MVGVTLLNQNACNYGLKAYHQRVYVFLFMACILLLVACDSAEKSSEYDLNITFGLSSTAPDTSRAHFYANYVLPEAMHVHFDYVLNPASPE